MVLICLSVIIPPTITLSLSFTRGFTPSSAGMKSAVVWVTFSLHISSYSSRGCPLTYIPSISFSPASISSFENSSSSGNTIPPAERSLLSFSSFTTKSNMLICPVRLFFLSVLISSTSFEYTWSFCLLLPGNSSIAPAFIKFSMARLLTSFPEVRLMKSLRSVNFPFFLSLTMESITGFPTLFIAKSPYLIPCSQVEKLPKPSFIEGGSTSIPIFLQSIIYAATLSVLSRIEVSREAINSTGKYFFK